MTLIFGFSCIGLFIVRMLDISEGKYDTINSTKEAIGKTDEQAKINVTRDDVLPFFALMDMSVFTE